MTATNKDFKVKNGLSVAGTAEFATDIILSGIQIAYDTVYSRLKMFVNNEWVLIPLVTDLIDSSQPIDGGTPSTQYSSIAIIDGGNV